MEDTGKDGELPGAPAAISLGRTANTVARAEYVSRSRSRGLRTVEISIAVARADYFGFDEG